MPLSKRSVNGESSRFQQAKENGSPHLTDPAGALPIGPCMPASSLLALLDDIATLLDDVSIMTKVAMKKTAGVLGDDLALNAEQVSGVQAERELSVVWAVAKGSAVNKLILVPAALAISALMPAAITPLLMIGGLFLCFEGCEKLLHKFLHTPDEEASHDSALKQAATAPDLDLLSFEKDKIKGAVRTDFILSAEIIVISLGTVADAPFAQQVMTLSLVAVLMTLGVYGLVGGIVKLDDLGLYWSRSADAFRRRLGGGILRFAPILMKSLSVLGTAAMFMVGGGILVHGLGPVHHWIENLGRVLGGGVLGWLAQTFGEAGFGVLAGAVIVALIQIYRKLLGGKKKKG